MLGLPQRGAALGGVALALAAGLAGCGGKDGGATGTLAPPSPTLSTSSPSMPPSSAEPPSLTPQAPEDPLAAAKVEAIQRVLSYYAEANVAVASGDTTKLRTFSAPNCDCNTLAKQIEVFTSKNQRLRGVTISFQPDEPGTNAGSVASVAVLGTETVRGGDIVDLQTGQVVGTNDSGPPGQVSYIMTKVTNEFVISQSLNLAR